MEIWVIVEVAIGTRGKAIGRGQNAAVIQWPKAPQCIFSFAHMCWSCSSPGALCFWVVPCRSPGRCCRSQQLSPQMRMCSGCSQSRQRHCWCQAGGDGWQQGSVCSPIQWALHQGWCCSWRLWSPWSRLCALVCLKMRPSFCAAKMLKMLMTSALTNSNNLLLLSLKLAKYFTPS